MLHFIISTIRLFLSIILLFVCSYSVVVAQQTVHLDIPPFKYVQPYTPQYPLKTDRMFYSDDDIAMARRNVDRYPGAKKIADGIIKAANYWVDWDDQDIVELMSTAQVPRAFDLNANGCPIHGAEVFNVGGTYPWIVDPKHPYQVKSPIDGKMFPTNDYATYYKSGFKEKKGWDTEYVDDGWGWVAPDGERYWFVAYANHWIWRSHIIPGILNLAKAYQLTGNKEYAHKSALMLHRLAEVYPSMNHEDQSRYGLMTRARNSVYRGKIINAIWETFIVLAASEAYDAVWDNIDDNQVLQQALGKTGEEIRAYIEANFLEEALRGFEENKVLGNFGMHQSAVLATTLARQYADPERYLNVIVDAPGESRSKMGLNYALYNQIFRDGYPLESPEYNFLWIRYLVILANLLEKQGVDMFAVPKYRRLLDAPIQSVAIGRYTPALGDGSDVIGALTGRNPETYQIAYEALGDSAYISWLNLNEDQYFTTYESLFRDVVHVPGQAETGRVVVPGKSRLFAGYGFGILNNQADETAMAVKYGMHYAHYHWDFLNVELFANGQKMMPDLGYPDAMNNYVKEVSTWSLNTSAHNTVVVDEKRQTVNAPGTLHHFAEGDFVQSIDASSVAYAKVDQYRRNLVMIDNDNGQSYVVDFFHVRGGKQHDYSLHGPPGKVTLSGGVWSAVREGTLAGSHVNIGEIYDDELLRTKGDEVGYRGYVGSGYQHLFNVQQLEQGNGQVSYKHIRDTSARLRIHVLPHEGQEMFVADAYDKPRAKKHILKYVITRRKAAEAEKTLNSTFIGVFETYKEKPYIAAVEEAALTSGTGAAVVVYQDLLRDVIVRDTANTVKILKEYGIETDANTAVVTFDDKNKVQRVYYADGTYLKVGRKTFESQLVEGVIRKVDVAKNQAVVEMQSGISSIQHKGLSGVFHLSNKYRTTVHPATATVYGGNSIGLQLHDDVLVGYFGVNKVVGSDIHSDTELNFFRQYIGTTLLRGDYTAFGQVVKTELKKVVVDQKLSSNDFVGQKVWLANIWEGDTVTFKPVFSWRRGK